MAVSAAVSSVWNEQFSRPDRSSLLAGLNKQDQLLVERCLERLDGAPRVRSSIRWHGVPWRWTIRYETDRREPVAFMIPEPRRPRLAVPLTAADLDRTGLKKLSKPVREGIALASAINGILWTEWVLSSRSQADELLGLVGARLSGLGLSLPAGN
ncbi:MAG: hypothetical protein DYG94_02080 [Leptolyngbya sp. PLA3]|nr:MAG: hypothetical protein EDM82_02475 [Cyanobacteria bacterium CYA]MCE7967520.1 hypothetical protein [Leptolyngbya sp. PL-A3]